APASCGPLSTPASRPASASTAASRPASAASLAPPSGSSPPLLPQQVRRSSPSRLAPPMRAVTARRSEEGFDRERIVHLPVVGAGRGPSQLIVQHERHPSL